jgi:tetratricopeptide (TPR) repeat protein
MFNRGGAAFEQGQFVKAEACFDRAIEAARPGPLVGDLHFWRGRVHLELGRAPEALRDFEDAAVTRRDGHLAACQAYACARARFSADCILASKEAIKAGLATAEVYNNLGYGHLCEGNFESALRAFDRALELKPGLPSALHNRALAEFRCSLRQRRPLKPQAVRDILEHISSGDVRPHAYYDAALLYWQLGRGSGQYREKVVDYLCRALKAGVDPEIVRGNFPSLLAEPSIERSLALEVPVARRDVVADYLSDPLAGQPFPFR